MKRLKNLSLFKVAIFFLLNIYLRNILILIISIIYLLIINKNELLIFIILLGLNFTFNSFLNDSINIGYIEGCKSSYCVINKILYKDKVYETEYKVGDIVLTNNSEKIDDDTLLKKNIKYISNVDKVIKSNTLIYKIKQLIDNSDERVTSLYKKILLNEYVSDLDLDFYLGYGLCVYYLLKKLFNKNKYLSFGVLILYTLIFGFEIKLLLIILDFILSFIDITNINKFSIKLIIIGFINIYLFFDYSLLVTFIFSFINMSNFSNNKLIYSIVQSLLFNQIQLFTSFFFDTYINIRIFMFISSLISLFVPILIPVYLFIMNILSFILKIINFSIRGRISFITILILIIIKYILKKDNQYLLLGCLLVCLITLINNPLKHVSFINVGQGDSILLRGTLNSYNVLIDTGSIYNYSKLKNHLFKEGIYNLDYLIITHNDSDHSGNIENLKKDFNIKNIISSPIDINIKDLYLKNYYLGYFDNDNDNSLIYETSINDLTFLFTGDISSNVERLLINNTDIDDIDILKVSHHGSKTGTSSQFVGNILPKYAIISTSGYYGHPHQNTIDTLEDYYVEILSTKKEGTITFFMTNLFNFIKTDSNKYILLSK